MTAYDQHTKYAVEDGRDGFVLTVYYSRFQLYPETDPVIAACNAALISVAQAIADQRGRQIEPIGLQGIRLSLDRNGYTHMTSCSAQVGDKWKESK